MGNKSKKSNLEILQNYLDGERPFVQVGYTPISKKRKDGEKWKDVSGTKWQQRQGYKITVNDQADLIRRFQEQKCACGQDIKFGNKYDQLFFSKTGKCYDCVIKEENELRVLGIYPLYEKWKMISNYLGYMQDVKRKINDSLQFLKDEPDSFDMVCNSKGFIERFRGLNTKQLLEDAKKDLKKINETIKIATKDKRQAEKEYLKALKKAKSQNGRKS